MEGYWYIYTYEASDECDVSCEQDMLSMVQWEGYDRFNKESIIPTNIINNRNSQLYIYSYETCDGCGVSGGQGMISMVEVGLL